MESIQPNNDLIRDNYLKTSQEMTKKNVEINNEPIERNEVNLNYRELALAIVGAVPEIGSVLGIFLSMIWTEAKEDVWTTIQGRVEKTVDRKIEDNDFRILQEELEGVKRGLKKLESEHTETNWRFHFESLNEKKERFLAIKHEEDYKLTMLPLAASFGVLFILLFKIGKKFEWIKKNDIDDINEFYTQVTKSVDDQYKRKIKQIKEKHKWSEFIADKDTAWSEFVSIHNMFVLDIYRYINVIDTLLNNKAEIYNKYHVYSPPNAFKNHEYIFGEQLIRGDVYDENDQLPIYHPPQSEKPPAGRLDEIPINFKEKFIRKLAIRHGGIIYGLHIWYSDGSKTSIGSSTLGELTAFELTGKYISQIDFYTYYSSPQIRNIKIYITEFGTSDTVPNIRELGGKDDGSDCKCTSVKFDDYCVSLIDGDSINDNIDSYYYVGWRTGFIPISEYKKLLESYHTKQKESGNTQIAANPIPGKCYNVVAKHSELFLNVEGGSKEPGARLIQYDKSDDDNSKWRLEDAGDGYFYLIAKHSNQVVNIAGGSRDNGATIIQYGRNEHDGSKWRLEDAGDGHFYIISKHSGKVLQINNSDWSNLAKITQWEKQNADHHKWKFVVV